MKRKMIDKYDAAEEARECVDRLSGVTNKAQFAVHYPEMIDGVVNQYNKKVSKRKIRSVGTVKDLGKVMRKSWY